MASYPVSIRRCQHIKTNGTQCGSPGLREEKFCYFHRECQPERIAVKGLDGTTSEILVPLWEDAISIQMMVRRVAMLLLEDKIDGKKAGQVLYALQIASANMKRLEKEKPRPVQVVIEPEKVAETPIGMTPWSEKPEGYEKDEADDDPVVARSKRAILKEQAYEERERQAQGMRKQLSDLKHWARYHFDHMSYALTKPEEMTRRFPLVREDMGDVIKAIDSQELVSRVREARERKAQEKATTQ